ncbi:hypothetical protein AB4099_18980 [Bosea sp. 2KB_26]|uniref:hypothetical protein n=1 Tax=Bosea sp. 2KB_26 TaxID=3237475 RepID=UPI003F935B8D
MGATITIASRAPMAIRLTQPEPNPEKPGQTAELTSIVISGAGNAAGVTEGLTHNVDADFYRAWVKANPNHPAVENGMFREVGGDEPDSGIQYGFAPASDAEAADGKAAGKSKPKT